MTTQPKKARTKMPAQEAPTKPGPVAQGSTAGSVKNPAQSQATAPPQPAQPTASSGASDSGGRKHDVDYTIEFLDDLPGEPIGSGTGRPSVFEDRIIDIKNDPSKHKKWARLASYKNGSAAAAAANVLRQRHGAPYVEGLSVETRRVDDRTLLFVKVDPSVVEEGGRERWNKAEAERKAKLAARKAAKEAEAKSNQPAGATASTVAS